MATNLESYHRKGAFPCPMCKGTSFDWMRDPKGRLLAARQDVRPVDDEAIVKGSVVLGGLNFLKCFRHCQTCSYTASFNLTASGDDLAVGKDRPR